MKLAEVFLRSIKDTLSWNVLKFALMAGVPLMLLWIGIGVLFWDPTLAFTSQFIGWVPFSILKANGAFLVGSFVWFQVVMVTFALVIAIFNVPIFRYLNPEKYEYFSVILILLIALFWTLFAFFNWDLIFNEVQRILTWFPFQTLQAGVAALLAMMIFYNFFIVSLALVVLIYRRPFLETLQLRDYPDATPVHSVKRRKFVSVAIRDLFIFFVLLILFYPLFFVPFVNMFLQIFFWAWLIRESYFLSASSLYASTEEINMLKKHGLVMWVIAFIASILNLVPIINILSPFFAQIMFFHWVMLNRSGAGYAENR
ncbi:MAG: hypothetical protein B6D59_05375 [Campylobacteraceae bacterium 4484_4]|nr:MAG: hypothetical protein B6D59_05375 [Campylobacteraceae bacterium 4484_4]